MPSSDEKVLIVSLHDTHPGSSQAIRSQRDDLRRWGVCSASLLVVPCFHHEKETASDAPLCEELSSLEKSGDELVLHGYHHDRIGLPESTRDLFWTRFYTSGEAEFLRMSEAEALPLWEKGKRLFQDQGWSLRGFIAPAWLFPDSLLEPMRRFGFRYTNRLTELIPLLQPEIHRLPMRSLCYSTRALWRRGVSEIWNFLLFQKLLTTPVLRLSLHPGDIACPRIWNQIERIVKSALANGYQPLTYSQYVERRTSS